jgi:prepilin-type N-terminal cleavage/methylation domain-containing protein
MRPPNRTSPTPPPRKRPARRRAFTLVELVVVILLMGIFAAVAAPTFFDSLMFHRVESAARRFKADLELAQQTARLTSRAQTITVLGSTYSATASVTDFDRPGETYTVDLSQPPYALSVVAANFDGSTQITFDGYGRPSSGGTIILEIGTLRCTLDIDPTTGQVTITSNHSRGRTAAVDE